MHAWLCVGSYGREGVHHSEWLGPQYRFRIWRAKAGRDMAAVRQPDGRISLSLMAMCSSGLCTAVIVLVATRV